MRQTNLPFIFGSEFLRDHAGHLISEPRIAIVELIANAYDAGATEARVTWPEAENGYFEVLDNGTGMTEAEFHRRWRTLCYNRMQEQGPIVQFPPNVPNKKRVAFGTSGKGRHSAFCFADSYRVETWKEGNSMTALIEMTEGGNEPFRCAIEKEEPRDGHGTRISAQVARKPIPVEQIREWIGSKFIVDPSFVITINDERLHLLDLQAVRSRELDVKPHGSVKIHQIDASEKDRSTKLRGITWWVNKRMVGQPSWDGLDQRGAILDGRTTTARKHSFVVEADILKPDVKDDWTGFHENLRSIAVRYAVRNQVRRSLDDLLAGTRKERKKAALEENRTAIGSLSKLSRRVVGQFIDDVQEKCPTLSQGDLARTVEVFAKMEQARSGYDLLYRLAACSPDDLDTWNHLMQEWTASNAEVVLRELGRRLELINQLEALVHAPTADELHDLQPLFARGLWIFGPEYEAVDFASNRRMATVIRQLLGGASTEISPIRPDFVALPDRSIGVYSADAYDEAGEVAGVRKVLIVELKKGGSTIGVEELRQGEDYAMEIRNGNMVRNDTEIAVYVLGASLDTAEERSVGRMTKVHPMMYDTLLKRAHSRTFHLQRKLESTELTIGSDLDVEEVLASPEQQELRNALTP